jgi:hypothetical protein
MKVLTIILDMQYITHHVLRASFAFHCPPQSFSAYSKLRVERMNVRMAGIRAKRAKEAEAAEKE